MFLSERLVDKGGEWLIGGESISLFFGELGTRVGVCASKEESS